MAKTIGSYGKLDGDGGRTVAWSMPARVQTLTAGVLERQVESVKSGGPYVMFGDGQLCACKPISEADLASYMADCITCEWAMRRCRWNGWQGQPNLMTWITSDHMNHESTSECLSKKYFNFMQQPMKHPHSLLATPMLTFRMF